jgi:type I restriction-modification system DNA methylase subunit
LPISVLCESGDEKDWRLNELIAQNTLLSVISFPPELFCPIGAYTIGMFIRKGIPHPRNQNVFWARVQHDGLLKIKGKRLPFAEEPNDFDKITLHLRAFLNDQTLRINNEPEFCKLAPINFEDQIFELIPEAYIDSKPISYDAITEGAETLVRENAALIIRFGREL